ncbi:MAG TPA: polysaccharide deacetylase family protein [Chthonomonadaceae bacterium]|nr:polysaccharide deacetylase family protein [Chthonomonadaceae bacterium]
MREYRISPAVARTWRQLRMATTYRPAAARVAGRPYPVPVLMYHKVGHPVACRQDTFLNVPAEDFRRQMRLLAALGYRARTFAEVVEAIVCGHTLPRRTFAVTFDDGYRCIGEAAVPVLAELNFPATIFVVPSGVGQTNVWDSGEDIPALSLLDWESLSRLISAGWEMGGHTHSHPHLDALDDESAYAQIVSGKQAVEERLGISLTTFCYPFGHYNARTPALVRAAGFLGATTTRSGLARPESDPFLIPRVKVAYRDGVMGLLYRILVRPNLPNTRPRRREYPTV